MTVARPPYTAVVFSSQRSETGHADEYEQTARQMVEMAQQQPGYLGVEGARGADGFGVTVSYWETPRHAQAWKRSPSTWRLNTEELGTGMPNTRCAWPRSNGSTATTAARVTSTDRQHPTPPPCSRLQPVQESGGSLPHHQRGGTAGGIRWWVLYASGCDSQISSGRCVR
ncbi:antibiotic biosynthesis monooxygenase [Kocuria kalidii]|uniref:antibiotic biosynthesis monooxygenase family protein n=1 Tax=Kocuria kalidii TaxID=3376283 RepID=UPI0037AEF3B8